MALVKKSPFFMAFYGHKIVISYHFYGFLRLRTNPVTSAEFLHVTELKGSGTTLQRYRQHQN